MNEFKWIAIFFFSLFIVMAVVEALPTDSNKETVRQRKWDSCLEVVNKAIPDPNATEERSALLKTCYEN